MPTVKMEIPEAIAILNSMKGKYSHKENAALHIATNALAVVKEYRTPMKITGDFVICPRCGNRLIHYLANYCEDCGQALDWSKPVDDCAAEDEGMDEALPFC